MIAVWREPGRDRRVGIAIPPGEQSSAAVSAEAAPAVGWCRPPAEVTLPHAAVHVWRADLDLDTVRLRRLRQTLSADELERAARYRFTADRERFIAARGLLRDILASYLDTAAHRLRFSYGVHGKPCMADAEHKDLRFNVSHSHATMLVAVAHQREVGVDIEHGSGSIAVEEIADTTLSAPERHVLSGFGGEAKRTAFLWLWARKEAYIKADGRGASLPLTQVDVSAPGGRAVVLNGTTGAWETSARWTLETLAAGPEDAGALAVEGQGWQLACWDWRR